MCPRAGAFDRAFSLLEGLELDREVSGANGRKSASENAEPRKNMRNGIGSVMLKTWLVGRYS